VVGSAVFNIMFVISICALFAGTVSRSSVDLGHGFSLLLSEFLHVIIVTGTNIISRFFARVYVGHVFLFTSCIVV